MRCDHSPALQRYGGLSDHGDRPLCVALHRDAVELLKWWRGADWAGFDRSDPGGEAWAWGVLDRLCAVVGSLGYWAGQVVLSAELVREV